MATINLYNGTRYKLTKTFHATTGVEWAWPTVLEPCTSDLSRAPCWWSHTTRSDENCTITAKSATQQYYNAPKQSASVQWAFAGPGGLRHSFRILYDYDPHARQNATGGRVVNESVASLKDPKPTGMLQFATDAQRTIHISLVDDVEHSEVPGKYHNFMVVI
jgi:hypothetical protein